MKDRAMIRKMTTQEREKAMRSERILKIRQPMPSSRAQSPFRPAVAVLCLGIAWLTLGWSQDAAAQELDERCVVSVLNRTSQAQDDGSWSIPNAPANMGMVRARATCLIDGSTVSGQSDFFLVEAGNSVDAPPIVFGAIDPVPVEVRVEAVPDRLTDPAQTAQVTVTAIYADGTTAEVGAEALGTSYTISNAAVATLTPAADGAVVTPLGSGRVLISASHEGVLGLVVIDAVLSADSDGDGLPDDLEVANGLDPSDPIDARLDLDGDGLDNRRELLEVGSNIRLADTDGDGLTDGVEVDQVGTSALLFDTDGDGVSDGLEVASGSDPLDPQSFNLDAVLAGIVAEPTDFALTFNSLLGETSTRLSVLGTLIDGSVLDLTARAAVYTSSDLAVCNFGLDPGRVFAGADGTCEITAAVGSFSAISRGTVSSFRPTLRAWLSMPGPANNVDVVGDTAFVAAGSAGLVTVDVLDRSAPSIRATFNTSGNAQDVKVLGGVAYVADGTGLRLIDVADPSAPTLLGEVALAGDARDVVVRGDFAFVAAGATGVHIVNVRDPLAPSAIGLVDTAGTAQGVDVGQSAVDGGAVLAVADGAGGLEIHAVEEISAPVLLGRLPIGGDARDVVVRGAQAFVADAVAGFVAVDLADPALPVRGAGVDRTLGGLLLDVAVSGNFAFGADIFFVNGVPILDVANPGNPIPREILDFSSVSDDNGTGIAVDNLYVYLTAGSRLFLGQYLDTDDRAGIPPTVSILAPADGERAVVGTAVDVLVDAVDDIAVAAVRFRVDGQEVFVDTTAPYEIALSLPDAAIDLVLDAVAEDLAGNAATSAPVTLRVVPDFIPPVIEARTPPDGASFIEGDPIAVTAQVSDNIGVASVRASLGASSVVDTVPPFELALWAPPVDGAELQTLVLEATDLLGNTARVEIPVTIAPRVDVAAPTLAILAPSDGARDLAGQVVDVVYAASDETLLAGFRLTAQGPGLPTTALDEGPLFGTGSFERSAAFTIPASAAPGDAFLVRAEVRDFGGNTTVREASVVVPVGEIYTGTNLDGSLDGTDVILQAGTYTAIEPLDLRNLTLLDGARVISPVGAELALTVRETLYLAPTASLDVTGRGFAGGDGASPVGGAPSWVAGSSPDAGGSHGGVGIRWDGPGPAGDVYDSVYLPTLAGGGGGRDDDGSGNGTRGGGVLTLDIGTLIVDGVIQARGGTSNFNSSNAAGAGGSIRVHASTVRGGGLIDVSSSNTGTNFTNGRKVGPGGGGRIALWVDVFEGFDPATQAKATGGRRDTAFDYGGAGTVFVHTAGDVHGGLRIDNGELGDGSDRLAAPSLLPSLGAGGVVSLVAEGDDARLTADQVLRPRWAGAYVRLRDVGDGDLGLFRVLEVDASGGALLQGAATVALGGGAATYAGEYRFDRLELAHGGRLESGDPLWIAEAVLEGDTRMPNRVEIGDLRVLPGAVARPTLNEPFHLRVTGTLVVDAGGRLDVSAQGFAGGSPGNVNGGAPDWVLPAEPDAGGAHGGLGIGWEIAGPSGEVFDSVYLPSLPGGGGSLDNDGSGNGTAGGGVLFLEVGTLDLEGEIRARGGTSNYNSSNAPGAGGTIHIQAGTVRGGGRIDASSSSTGTNFTNGFKVGPGGGGRIALWVDSFDGFDPATQTQAIGGQRNTTSDYGGAGTVFVHTAGNVHGRLLVDNGELGDGTDRIALPSTLPILGGGAVATMTAEGGDARLTAAEVLRPRWAGAYARLLDAEGGDLGLFRVLEVDEAGSLLLEGAATVALDGNAAVFAGEYRFDRLDLLHGARIDAVDPLWIGEAELQGDTRLPNRLEVGDLRVLSGAVARPAVDAPFDLRVSGTLTIEAGGRLDVSAQGYLGGRAGHVDGEAPEWVLPAQPDAGGAHGGRGVGWESPGPSGEVFDSVYLPSLAGGGGSRDEDNSGDGTAGGGVLFLEVGTLDLEGEIRARGGTSNFNSSRAAGAGGTVRIHAGTVRGGGLIDVSSSDTGTNFTSGRKVGPGGGGRIALWVDSFNGFDPATQTRAIGGRRDTANDYGGAGTVFVHASGSVHGHLLVDNGELGDGTDRVALPSLLPILGGGAVSALEAEGGDARLTAAVILRPRWAGAYARLFDVDGGDLGVFRVLDVDTAGRILLEGAASAVGAATSYVGEYRFDRLDLFHGARIDAADPVWIGEVEVQGDTRLPNRLEVGDLRIPAGAIARPALFETFDLQVRGTLTIDAGGRLDVSGWGYAGGRAGHVDGDAPEGLIPSSPDAGGSHGGIGIRWDGPGPAGEVFDSVYLPILPGGGGGRDEDGSGDGTRGGGVLILDVGTLELAGEIRARGATSDFNSSRAPGAGGTVRIHAGAMRGGGLIDASSSDTGTNFTSGRKVGPGGGGRIALWVDTFDGFDPDAQVHSLGGRLDTSSSYGAPGTLFIQSAADVLGRLVIDNGAGRVGPITTLPTLGAGTVIDSEIVGADAWIGGDAIFRPRWLGAFLVFTDGGGGDLGVGRVLDIDAQGRALVEGGAAFVGLASGYRGEYRFDRIDLRNGSRLGGSDPVVEMTRLGAAPID